MSQSFRSLAFGGVHKLEDLLGFFQASMAAHAIAIAPTVNAAQPDANDDAVDKWQRVIARLNA